MGLLVLLVLLVLLLVLLVLLVLLLVLRVLLPVPRPSRQADSGARQPAPQADGIWQWPPFPLLGAASGIPEHLAFRSEVSSAARGRGPLSQSGHS